MSNQDLSQKTEPTQFPESGQSQYLSIGSSVYTGIKVQVSFGGALPHQVNQIDIN